jgi:hypothetical protein
MTLTVAAALVPISLAPLRRLPFARTPVGRRATAGAVLAGAIFVSWALANHLEVLERRRSATVLDADSIALGAWLRQEIERPQRLPGLSPAVPIRLWLQEPSLYPMLAIVYAAGYPDRVQEWKGADPAASLKAGQYLVSDRPVDDANLVRQVVHGRYTVYRAQLIRSSR